MARRAHILCGLSLLGAPLAAPAADPSSVYLSLPSDTPVGGTRILLTTTVSIASAGTDVLVASDGRYFPSTPGRASVFIAIDGVQASSDGAIDWSQSTDPRQHAFEVVGAANLAAG